MGHLGDLEALIPVSVCSLYLGESLQGHLGDFEADPGESLEGRLSDVTIGDLDVVLDLEDVSIDIWGILYVWFLAGEEAGAFRPRRGGGGDVPHLAADAADHGRDGERP